MATFPPRPSRMPRRRPPAVAALLGWLMPGFGQLYVGRPVKASLFFVAILPTFLLGWLLTDLTAVDPDRFRLDFAGQIFLGLPTLGALVVGGDHVLDTMPSFYEVGRLYVLVAGLLNVVAICDAIGEAIARDRTVLAGRLDAARARASGASADDDDGVPPAEAPSGEDDVAWEASP